MILSGMGPVDRMDTAAGKLFAAFYALFSGVVFIGVMGVVLAPWVHRLMHVTHLDDDRRPAEGRTLRRAQPDEAFNRTNRRSCRGGPP